ncbi:MAG: regulator of sigma E protease, partial [Planctomycetota bacterium]
MSIILFIVILGLLIFVHELGHFLLAKWTGMRVHKFAIGFRPNLFSWKRGETTYEINLIPFGGYVKIEGENHDADAETYESNRSFGNKTWWQQSLVLLAGIFFNLLLAWIALTATLLIGVPAIYDGENTAISDPVLTILDVLPESPAEEAGLVPGDQVLVIAHGAAESLDSPTVSEFQEFSSRDEVFSVTVSRVGEQVNFEVQPMARVATGDDLAIGVALDMVGTLQVPFPKAILEGFMQTAQLTGSVAGGLTQLIGDAVTGQADLEDVSGPVGIVSLVNDAQRSGLVALLLLMAVISINLALLNLVPFPAL